MTTPPPGPLPFAWFASFKEPVSPSSFLPSPLSFSGSSLIPHPSSVTSRDEYISCVEKALAHIRAGDIYQVNYTIRAALQPESARPGGSDLDFGFSSFLTLLAAAPMPHAAYISPPVHGGIKGGLGSDLDLGFGIRDFNILSLSPELFLRRRGSTLESRPMKGTAKREPSWAADEAARIALSRDEKNRAENVMIVDLVRNDLGRVCKMGSITVPELWRVDRFPTVHQMTSLVRGELRENVSLFEIFAALFPPGSVTGAPKIRAMQIIADLEPTPRGIYCGTIGLFFPNGDFECNVAIRTIQRIKDKGERKKESQSSYELSPSVLGLGSGIVADSDPETEWQETQLKGEFVTLQPRDFILYETIRWGQRRKDKGERIKEKGERKTEASSSFIPHPSSFLDLHSHLRRLRHSCIYFGHPFPLKEIIGHLRELQPTLGASPARIKLDLRISPPVYGGQGSEGGFKFQVSSFHPSSFIPHPSVTTSVVREHLSWPKEGMSVMLSDLRLDPNDFRLYHKTNLRPEKYEELEKARALGCTEVLFLNTRGELCEGALSNIILKINDEWLTPALHCGLLPGTWREKLLSGVKSQASSLKIPASSLIPHPSSFREAILTLDDLQRAEEIRMGNAVRGEGSVLKVLRSDGCSFREVSIRN